MAKNNQLLIVISLVTIFFSSLLFYDKNQVDLNEKDYFNKFCSKYYDVSCDKIKIK